MTKSRLCQRFLGPLATLCGDDKVAKPVSTFRSAEGSTRRRTTNRCTCHLRKCPSDLCPTASPTNPARTFSSTRTTPSIGIPGAKRRWRRRSDENKPIFLSIGYSACHWCHVMEHESFENAGIAKYLNENFVSIKVDREERPDLDQIYMNAVSCSRSAAGGR